MFHIWAYFSWWFCTHSPHPHPSRYSGTLHFDTWKDSITHNRKEVLFLPSQPMLPLQTKFSEQQQKKKDYQSVVGKFSLHLFKYY